MENQQHEATIRRAAQAAINAGCNIVQLDLNVTSGDFAGVYFSGGEYLERMENTFRAYLLAELDQHPRIAPDSAYAPWHLFYIEAEVNPDERESTIRAWMVSAQSESIDKAEELARAAVMDDVDFPGPDVDTLQTCGITHCEHVTTGNADVYRSLGIIQGEGQ